MVFKDTLKNATTVVALAALVSLVGCAQPSTGSGGSGDDKSSNADLASLTVDVGALAPEFSASVTEYTVSLGYKIAAITATATAADAKAVVSGDSGKAMTLSYGANVITVTVTAEDGTAKTTHVTVTRASPADRRVTFNKNADDATGTMADLTIAQGASAALTACGFARTGFTFGGWATAATGDAAYADGASYTMGDDDVALYATWLAKGTVGATVIPSGNGSVVFSGAVSVEKGNDLVITVGTAGLSDFAWYLDGTLLAGKTGSVLTLSTGSMKAGTYYVMVVARNAANVQYSAGLTVKITN